MTIDWSQILPIVIAAGSAIGVDRAIRWLRTSRDTETTARLLPDLLKRQRELERLWHTSQAELRQLGESCVRLQGRVETLERDLEREREARRDADAIKERVEAEMAGLRAQIEIHHQELLAQEDLAT